MLKRFIHSIFVFIWDVHSTCHTRASWRERESSRVSCRYKICTERFFGWAIDTMCVFFVLHCLAPLLPAWCAHKSKHLSVSARVLTTTLRYKLSKLYLHSANASCGFVCLFCLFCLAEVFVAFPSARLLVMQPPQRPYTHFFTRPLDWPVLSAPLPPRRLLSEGVHRGERF